jgi:hypothetical protein
MTSSTKVPGVETGTAPADGEAEALPAVMCWTASSACGLSADVAHVADVEEADGGTDGEVLPMRRRRPSTPGTTGSPSRRNPPSGAHLAMTG